jgi:hypothetical protein
MNRNLGHRWEKEYNGNLWRPRWHTNKGSLRHNLSSRQSWKRCEARSPIAQICREWQLTDSLVDQGRQEFLEKAPDIFETKQTAATMQNDQAERIAELERLVGQLTMENALLKKRNESAGSTTAEKRAMIDALHTEASVQQLCAVFDCPRSTYYYRPAQRDETVLWAAIEQVLMRRPWFGYRRVVAQLQREGVQVGETVVRRLLKTWGHTCSVGPDGFK